MRGKKIVSDQEAGEYEEETICVYDEKKNHVQRKRMKPLSDNDSHGRNGHTLRFNYCYNGIEKNLVISRGSARHDPFSGGEDNNEIPITEIDQYFDHTFIDPSGPKSFQFGRSTACRPLNSYEKWEEVEELLWSKAVSIGKEYSSFQGFTYTFDIPILGHYIIPKEEDCFAEDYNSGLVDCHGNVLPYTIPRQLDNEWSRYMTQHCAYLSTASKSQRRAQQKHRVSTKQQSDWLYWQGKYYNPQFVYEIVPTTTSTNGTDSASYLRPVCRYVAKKADDPCMQLGPIHIGITNNIDDGIGEDKTAMVRNKHAHVMRHQEHTGDGNTGRVGGKEVVLRQQGQGQGQGPQRLAAVAHYEPAVLSQYHPRFYHYHTGTNTTTHSTTKTKKVKVKEYVEVELSEGVCVVSGIGLMGGYPQHLRRFPFTSHSHHHTHQHPHSHHNHIEGEEEGVSAGAGDDVNMKRRRNAGKRVRMRRRHRRQKGRPQVAVIQHPVRDVAWVTAYTIYYRDLSTGKWVQYQPGTVFPGNEDLFEEVHTAVHITTRALRIVPVAHHHAIAMRVMVYGTPLPTANNPTHTTHNNTSTNTGSIITTKKEEKIPTVQYSLHVPHRSELHVERSHKSRWKEYCWGDHLPVMRKKVIIQQLQEARKERYVEAHDEVEDEEDVEEEDEEEEKVIAVGGSQQHHHIQWQDYL